MDSSHSASPQSRYCCHVGLSSFRLANARADVVSVVFCERMVRTTESSTNLQWGLPCGRAPCISAMISRAAWHSAGKGRAKFGYGSMVPPAPFFFLPAAGFASFSVFGFVSFSIFSFVSFSVFGFLAGASFTSRFGAAALRLRAAVGLTSTTAPPHSSALRAINCWRSVGMIH
jgi:hypothetical protein